MQEILPVQSKPKETDDAAAKAIERMREQMQPSAADAAAQVQATPKESYLHEALNTVTSRLITDDAKRETANHLGGEFLKTAALFSKGKFGVATTVLTYGLDKASRDTTTSEKVADFTLGASKGLVIKGLFGAVSKSYSFAPTKGVLMGIAARDAEVIFDRETFSNPNKTLGKLRAETLNPQAWLFDAAVFGVGEGAFHGVNKAMGGRLVKNELASGMVLGGSFGTVNGGTAEIMKQVGEGKGSDLDWGKVIYKGVTEGGVGALGAGFGIKGSDPRLHASIRRSLESAKQTGIESTSRFAENMGLTKDATTREFVVVGGKDNLAALTGKTESSAMLSVKEVSKFLGFERLGATTNLFVQKLGEGQPGIRPAADKADLLATCFPESLSAALKAKHIFPEGKGPVWLEAKGADRVKIALGDTPFQHRNYNPIGQLVRLDGHQITMNVMGPLEIGNVRDPNNPSSKGAWEAFERELGEAKKIGADAVSTDVWWGAVEPKPGEFNWNYYDMLSTKIAAHGLKWVPILSLHQCGGNIGDTSNVPIPMWIWSKIQSSAKSDNPDVGKYKSEQGNTSSEYVSAWSTDHALPYYKRVMSEFQNQYGGKAAIISEINVSLGPAGELRYPSYNAHDSNSGYPTRGALQSYSDQAKASFKEFAISKYGSEEAVKQTWGEKYGAAIEPPKNVEEFYNSGDYKNSQFGKDFFDWYHGSLTSHGTKVISTALDVFGSEGSQFAGIDIGAKMPGVHWRVGAKNGDQVVLSDRQAELSAGLITTSRNDWQNDADGRGYRPIISMFKDLQSKSKFSRVIPHFTALEMADGHEGPAIQSLPYTLARWVGEEANRQGLVIKGENALAWNLPDPASWQRMSSLMKGVNQNGLYDGLTFLRISDVLSNDVARAQFQDIIAKIRPPAEAQPLAEAK